MDKQNQLNKESQPLVSALKISQQGAPSQSRGHKPGFLSSFKSLLIFFAVVVLSISFLYIGSELFLNTKPAPPKLPTQTPENPTSNWKTFISATKEYSVKYPPDWSVSEQELSDVKNRAMVAYFAELNQKGEDFISISAYQDANNLTLQQDVERYIKNITNGEQKMEDFKSEEIILDNNTALKVTGLPARFTSVHVFVKYNKKLYVLANADTPYKVAIFNTILSTFKFLDVTSAEGEFCGGIAAIQCPSGYSCKLDGNYPDAGGKCVKDSTSQSSLPQPAKLALEDLAKKLNIESSNISVVKLAEVEWSDSSLGCPKPGMFYAQVITPGYRVVLSYQNKQYTYHTNKTTTFVQCDPQNATQ